MKTFRIGSLAVWAAVALLAGCGKKDAGYLKMGTDPNFPPFATRVGAEVVGFDVDVAQAIAAAAGKPLKIVEMASGDLLPALAAGKVDLVLAALEITDERRATVDFSIPYYKARQMALILAGGPVPETQEELKGGKIGAVAGTPGAAAAAELAAAEDLRTVASPMAAARDLMNSQLDVAILDEQPAVFLAEHHPELMLIDAKYPEARYGVAVRKGDTNLLATVDRTLEALVADGRYEELVGKWLIHAAGAAEPEE